MKSNIGTGFARPTLFRVKIADVPASKQPEFRINCYQAQIPGSNLAITDKDNSFRSAAYHRIYSDIILGFYCSENMQELEFFQKWIDRIVDPDTNQKGYYGVDTHAANTLDPEASGYTTTVVIEKLSRTGPTGGEHDLNYSNKEQPKMGGAPYTREKELYETNYKSYDAENDISARWKLFEAFPRQIDPIQLDYGTTDTIMSVNVTLTYRNFKHEFNPTPHYNSIDMGEETINKWGQRSGGGARRNWT
tara:strand:+ start:148 stop:891 length:744 start_codon:yes stop_codon:yes gene_type:complete